MAGFTLKCNNCGKEITINSKSDFHKEIYFYNAGYDGELGVNCACCDNYIDEIEDSEHCGVNN